jgi:energy-coupling factor transporter ATP-binding protein EcfA2
MWVEKIILENIKCFQQQELVFTHNSSRGAGMPLQGAKAKPYRWITLLGENGVGKSTFLQALSLLLAGPEAAKELMPRPSGWVRDSSKPGRLTVTVHKESDDGGSFGEEKVRKTFSHSYYITGDQNLKIKLGKSEGETIYTSPAIIENPSRELGWLRTNAFASGSQGWFAVGYGAFRRLTRLSQIIIPSLELPIRSSNFTTQFNEDIALSSFERWAIYLDYRIAKDTNDVRAKHMYTVGADAITRLLPGDVKIAEVSSSGLIVFEVNGQRVPTVNLSDGFRSIIALAGDLIWRLLLAFPHLEDPRQASGVVLIDELDIHLHPSWQREIAGWLQDTFPNLQFFVATHSPLVAAGGGDNALTLKFETSPNGTVTYDIVTDLSTLDSDRILRSPAFGMKSTYSPPTQKKMDRYDELRRKRHQLKSEEEAELGQLSLFMQTARPTGDPPQSGSLEARIDAYLDEKLPPIQAKVLS